MPATERATLAEIYNTLNQLVEAYVNVMATFQSVVSEVGEIKNEVQGLRGFMEDHLVDAVQARDVWRANAEAHKNEVEVLRQQLQEALGGRGMLPQT